MHFCGRRHVRCFCRFFLRFTVAFDRVGQARSRTARVMRSEPVLPLREFIAGNLFDDLLTPEVEVLVPTGARDEAFDAELLPAMRTLRELMPGNVTRHFGVSSLSRRHWVALNADRWTRDHRRCRHL